MTLRYAFLLLVLFCLPKLALAQYATGGAIPTVNGAIVATTEYGSQVDGNNQNTNSGIVTYSAYTSTNLYVGVSGANIGEGFVMYIDKDPQVPVNAGTNSNGTNVGFNYDGASFSVLPFRADIVLYVKNGYREYRLANGSNGWGTAVSAFGAYADAGTVREFSLPWSVLGGVPASYNFFSYNVSSTGSVYNTQPTANATGFIGTSARYERYYTATPVSSLPFARDCFVFNSATDENNFGAISVYDFTMNTAGLNLSRSNTASGAWTIGGTLVVGAGNVYFGATGGSGYGATTVNNINLPNTAATALLSMDYNTQTMLVNGSVTMTNASGTLALSNSIGGDVNLKGSFTKTAGTFNANSRQVQFSAATVAQTFTSNVVETLPYILNAKTGAGALTFASGISVPSPGIVTLNTGTTTNLTAGASTVALGASITSAGQLSVTTPASLTVAGTLTNTAGATNTSTAATLIFTQTGNYVHNLANGTIPTATWTAGTPGATCTVTGATTTGSQPAGLGQSFYHFTWACPGQTQNVGLSGGLTTVNGNLSIPNTGGGSFYLSLQTGGADVTVNVGGDLIVNASGYLLGHSGSSPRLATVNVNGNYSQTAGKFLSSNGTAGTVINLKGNFAQAAGTLDRNGGSTFTFNFVKATGTQTFAQGGTIVGATFNVGDGTSAGTTQLTSNLIQTTTTGAFNVLNAATVDFQTYYVGGTSTFSSAAGSTLLSANISASGTFTASGTNGSVQVTGTRTYDAGTNYNFNGISPQFAGSGITGANNFTLTNTSGVTLGSSFTVTGTLALASVLSLGNFDLTLLGTLTGNSSTIYIRTTGTGQYKLQVGTTPVVFPIGNSAYNPITLSNAGTADVYGFRVVDAAPPAAANPALTVQRYWVVSENVAGGNDLSVKAQYNASEQGASFAAGAQPYIGLYNSVNFKQQQATITGSGPFVATSLDTYTPIDLFSAGLRYFAVGKDTGLAVPRVDYTWKGTVSTDWGTATNWDPTGVPTTNNNVIVQDAGSPFKLDLGSANRTIADFTVKLTGSFTAGAGRTLTIAGDATYSSSATSTLNNTSTVVYSATGSQLILPFNYGNVTASAGPRVLQGNIGISNVFLPGTSTFTLGTSTVDFNGTGAQSIPAIQYYNLTISNARVSSPTLTLATGTISVLNAMSVTATGFNATVANTGNTVDFNGTGAQTVPAFAGFLNLTISNARGANSITLAPGIIGVKGAFAPNATFTTGGYVVTGNTVDYTATTAQTIPGFNYNNLSNSGNGARTLSNTGIIDVAGVYTPTTAGLTVGSSTFNFSGTGTQAIPAVKYNNLTNTGNGARTLPTTGTVDLYGNLTPGTGTWTITNSTIRFNVGTGTTFTFPVIATNITGRSYYNLELAGASSTTTKFQQTAGSTLGVAGNYLNVGGQHNIGTTGASTFIVDGNATLSGTLARIQGSTAAGSATMTVGGDFTSTSTAANWMAWVNGAGAATLNIAGDFSQSASTALISNAAGAAIINVSGTFTLSGSALFVLKSAATSTNSTVTVTGAVSVAGTASINMENTSSTSGVALFVAQSDASFTSTIGGTVGIVNFGTGSATGNEFRIGGNFVKSGTGFFYTSGTTADPTGFTFNKAGVQTFNYSGASSAGTSYKVAVGSTLQVLGGLTLGAGTTPDAIFTVNGVIDLGTQVIAAGSATDPSFVLASGATLFTGNSGGVLGSLTGFGASLLTLSSNATYGFNGTGTQVTSAFTTTPTAATISKLKIANTGGSTGVTLSAGLAVNDSLVFTNGILTLGANTLTLANSIGLAGQGLTRYVAVTGAGGLTRKTLATGVATLFPIGTATSYAPVTISNQAAAADFTAQVQAGPTGTLQDATKVVNLQWPIASTSTSANLTFQWNTANQAAGFNPANPIEVGRYVGPGYTIVASALTATGSNPYAVTASGLTGFSAATPFVVGNTSSIAPTTYTWTGATNTSWATPTNWSPNGVPIGLDNLILNIPGTNTLTIADARAITNFTFNGTGALAITSAGTLTVSGTFTYGGTPTATLAAGSTFNIASAASQPVPPLRYGNLNLTGGARVFSATDTVGIAGTLTPGAGALTFTGSTLKFNGTGAQTIPVLAYNNLAVSNAAGASLAGTTTVSGNFALYSGAALPFAATNYMLNVQGALYNTGTISGTGSSKVALNGTSAQTMTGRGTYHNLEINNSANVTSTGRPTVTNSLNMVLGKLNTGSDTLVLGSAATLTENVAITPQSFVRGNVRTIRVVGTAGTSFGGIGFDLSAGSNLGTVFVNRQSGTAVAGQGVCCTAHHSILRQYTVIPSQQPAAADRNVFVRWPSEDDNGQNMTFMQLYKSPDGIQPYAKIGPVQNLSSSNPRAGFISHIASFSVFTAADNVNTLPLGLTTFTGQVGKGGTLLAWTITSEKAWAHFVIERSPDGKTFSAIGSTDAVTNARAENRYSYLDQGLSASRYYRLRLTDLDGKTDYSDVLYFAGAGQSARALRLFPNPASSTAQLSIDGQTDLAETLSAQLYSMDGHLLESFEGTLSNLNAGLAARVQVLPAGIYQIKVQAQDQSQMLKLLKQ